MVIYYIICTYIQENERRVQIWLYILLDDESGPEILERGAREEEGIVVHDTGLLEAGIGVNPSAG